QLLLIFATFTTATHAQVITQPQDTLAVIEESNGIPKEIADNIKKYKLGKITVSGNVKYNEMTIQAITGLVKGQEISIPGEQLSNAIHKLWNIGTFSEIDFFEQSVEGDVINLELRLKELPKINNVTLEGLGKNKTKELLKDIQPEEDRGRGKTTTNNFHKHIQDHIEHNDHDHGVYQPNVDSDTAGTADERPRALPVRFDKGKTARIPAISFTGHEQLSGSD